jgi:hypothetical protein
VQTPPGHIGAQRHPSGAEADMFRARLPAFICVLKNTLPYL